MGWRSAGDSPNPDQMQTTELQLLWTPRDKQLLLLLLQGRTEEEGTGTRWGTAAQVLNDRTSAGKGLNKVKLNLAPRPSPYVDGASAGMFVGAGVLAGWREQDRASTTSRAVLLYSQSLRQKGRLAQSLLRPPGPRAQGSPGLAPAPVPVESNSRGRSVRLRLHRRRGRGRSDPGVTAEE